MSKEKSTIDDAELAAIETCVSTLSSLAKASPVSVVRALHYLRLRFEESSAVEAIRKVREFGEEMAKSMAELTARVKREIAEQKAAFVDTDAK